MSFRGNIFTGVNECVSFGLVSMVGLIVLSVIILAQMLNLAPEVAPEVILISWAQIVILACADAVGPLLRLALTLVFRLLDWTREELDAGRTNWTAQREADVDSRDVDVVGTIDPEHNHSSFRRASETKLSVSRILELSTVPTTAIPCHDLDQSTIRVTYDSTPVMLPNAHICKKRSSSGLADPTEDPHARKDTWETPKFADFDENPFRDEDVPLAAELETVEPQKAAEILGCREPRGQTACLLFSKWPLEIRRLVYHELMVASFIDHPDRLVNDRLTTLVTSKAQRALYKLGIDATVLRTCRLIYIEALSMLYGENNFVFFSASALDLFRDKGLVGTPYEKCDFINVPSFNFGQNKQGRLLLIRRLTLVLTDERDDRWGPLRPSSIQIWSEFLHESRFERRTMRPCVDFPALDDLTLDFTAWALDSEEEIVVRPFVERLRPRDGLRRLCIKGVSHQASLDRLRIRLLKIGGTFASIDGTHDLSE